MSLGTGVLFLRGFLRISSSMVVSTYNIISALKEEVLPPFFYWWLHQAESWWRHEEERTLKMEPQTSLVAGRVARVAAAPRTAVTTRRHQ